MPQFSLHGFWDKRSWGWQNFWGNKEAPRLWVSEIDSSETSQHLFDPFVFDHVTGGALLYILVPLGGINFHAKNNMKFQYYFINLFIHIMHELIENTPCIIFWFRSFDYKYTGDSFINSVGDVLGGSIGWWLAYWVTYNGGWLYYIILLIVVQTVSSVFGGGFAYVVTNKLEHIRKSGSGAVDK